MTQISGTCAAGTACLPAADGEGFICNEFEGGSSCEDRVIVLAFPGSIAGSNFTGDDAFDPSCAGDGDARDVIYRIDHPGGSLTATLSSNFDAVLEISTLCGDTAGSLGCADSAAVGTESIALPGIGFGSYFIMVDGFSGSAGNFDLTVNF
jgi:hypothetical protein